MTKTTLLIDGDILAFRSVSVNYHEIEWEADLWTYHVDMVGAKDTMRGLVEKLEKLIEPDETLVCITGAGETFRHRLWPTYKGHRKPKPPGYRAFQDWLQEEFKTYLRPGLEADDSLGILMTADDIVPGLKVLWSGDKDLKQIPGLHLDDATGKVVKVAQFDGDHFHAYQTLIGDTTDNYPGCPGVGPTTAVEALECLEGPEQFTHEFKSGPRKGQTETRYRMVPMRTPWDVVEAFYRKAGLTREDMLVQARVARILTADWFDFDNKEPILWNPPT